MKHELMVAKALVLAAALAHAPAAAQTVPAVQTGEMQAEVRGGITVGNHTAHHSGLDIAPGLSVDVVIRRQILPAIAVYGGYFRTAFVCEEGYCEDPYPNISVVGNHGVLGVEWNARRPWVRGGIMVGSTKAGELGDDPSMGMGFHAAVGLTVGTGQFRFLPGLSYRWMSATQGDDKGHAVALAVDLGFAYRLGGGS